MAMMEREGARIFTPSYSNGLVFNILIWTGCLDRLWDSLYDRLFGELPVQYRITEGKPSILNQHEDATVR